MAKKNLYIKEEDEELWRRAEELVKETQRKSLSRLIPDLLKREIEKMEMQEQVLEDADRIVVDILIQEWDGEEWEGERRPTRSVAFQGKWIVKDYYAQDGASYSVALTGKRQLFVAIAPGRFELPICFQVYPTFDLMEEDRGEGVKKECWPGPYPDDLLSLVASVVGEMYVEELDI